MSRINRIADRPQSDHLHRIEVVSLYFEIRYSAVSLSGLHIGVPQEVLDGAQIRIRIEKLRGHRVP